MRTKKKKSESAEAPAPAPADTIGRKFSHAREALGLTVEDAAHVLRMRVSLVRDLENDDLQNFSHPSYARLSLLDYARFLRISDAEVRPWLPDPGSPMTSHYQYLDRFADPEPAARREDVLEQSRRHNPLAGVVRLLLIVAVLAVVAYGALLVTNLTRITHTGGNESTMPPGSPATSEPATEPAALPSPEEERQWLVEKEEVFTGVESEMEPERMTDSPAEPASEDLGETVTLRPADGEPAATPAATPVIPRATLP